MSSEVSLNGVSWNAVIVAVDSLGWCCDRDLGIANSSGIMGCVNPTQSSMRFSVKYLGDLVLSR